ncbi:hypothetical protein Fmac_008356 [Flemingia macrophylla]|uniref:Uncharacterized protein n=1 Tax=Flemingia macrophylla TaxID=520843 RepID=A0ABD1MX71_9FABA
MSILRLTLQPSMQTTRAAEARHLIEMMASNSQFAETRKLEGKLDALVKLVTQLATITAAEASHLVEKMTSNSQQFSTRNDAIITTTAEARHLIKKMGSNSKYFKARNDAIFIRGVHYVATDTSTKNRKLEGKLDAPVNLVTQLAQTTTTVEAKQLIKNRTSNSKQFSARNDAIIIRGVHDVAIDISADTRKLEGKLDAIVNLVTQLFASIARVFGICSFNDHHTNAYPSLNVRNEAVVIRGVHDVATDTSAETRKLVGKLDALVKLVTQLAVNYKPAFVARVFGIRASNDCRHPKNPALSMRRLLLLFFGNIWSLRQNWVSTAVPPLLVPPADGLSTGMPVNGLSICRRLSRLMSSFLRDLSRTRECSDPSSDVQAWVTTLLERSCCRAGP